MYERFQNEYKIAKLLMNAKSGYISQKLQDFLFLKGKKTLNDSKSPQQELEFGPDSRPHPIFILLLFQTKT